MKNIILFVLLLFFVQLLKAQEPVAATKLARHIAAKMTDSLRLSNAQRETLVEINIDLSREKAKFFDKSRKKEDIEKELQKIERTRDKKYEKVLTKEQYELYLQKKFNLLSSK